MNAAGIEQQSLGRRLNVDWIKFNSCKVDRPKILIYMLETKNCWVWGRGVDRKDGDSLGGIGYKKNVSAVGSNYVGDTELDPEGKIPVLYRSECWVQLALPRSQSPIYGGFSFTILTLIVLGRGKLSHATQKLLKSACVVTIITVL